MQSDNLLCPASALSTVPYWRHGDALWVTGHQNALITGDSAATVPAQTY